MSLVTFIGYSQLPENFEGTFPPTGWAVFTSGSGTSNWNVTTAGVLVYPDGGTQSAYIARENVGQGNTSYKWMVTPAITGLNANSELRFQTRQQFVGNSGTIFELRYSTTSQTDINSFITIATWNESTLMNGTTLTEQITYIQKGVDLTSFGVQDVFIAFVMENDNGDRWFIDDISFIDKCQPPSQLSFENTSATSANLQWTETGIATQWEIEVLPINSNTNGVGNKTSINSFNVTNLTPNAWYKFYVRSICQGNPGGDITSEWIGPKEFQAIPICPTPSLVNYEITNYNGNSADLTWSTNSQATSYEIVIQPLGSGIPSNSSGVFVTQSSYHITNLNPDLIYEVYVRSICANGTSGWSNPKLINNNTGDCTDEYNSTEVVSDLFRKLLNHLRQKVNNNEVIPNGYVCPELTNLEEHITDANPKIYNFDPIDFSFSFHPNSLNDSIPDVKINNWLNTDNPIIDQIYINHNFIDASDYTYIHNNITLSDNSKIALAKVKHINFCSNCLVGEIQPSSSLCINQPIEFTFNTLETNLIYDWTFYDLDGITPLLSSNQSNPIVNYLTGGSYIVKLLVDNPVKKCKVEFITTFHLKDCTNCERHIAIVVDESGSIDEKEARKIRAQLKSFINKQASDNDILGTNVFISLIGLSDSDINTRNDHNHIIDQHINASNKNQYLNWINGYRTNRVSPNSDYWNSGLTKALETNPDFVILITDGCQTNSASDLATTMQSFNNNNGATTGGAGKPHLFVVGIEDGFYVDSDTSSARKSILTKEEDPNLNPELSRTSSTTARVSSFLRTSLKYLMAYGNSYFPSNDKYSFLTDYYGANDFNFFYDEPNYLSNGLIAKSFSVADGETTLIDPVDMSCGEIIPLEGCNDCLNFKPEEGKKYIISAWVKEEINKQVISYTNPTIQIKYLDNSDPKIEIGIEDCITSGDIIDGWQRIFKQITIPENTAYIQIALVNNSTSIPVYFDDVRIHPMDGSMKSFVYDPETFRLMAELDENNYSTFYEYDKEGGLVRVKKETSRGVKTIQETRSGNVIKQE